MLSVLPSGRPLTYSAGLQSHPVERKWPIGQLEKHLIDFGLDQIEADLVELGLKLNSDVLPLRPYWLCCHQASDSEFIESLRSSNSIQPLLRPPRLRQYRPA